MDRTGSLPWSSLSGQVRSSNNHRLDKQYNQYNIFSCYSLRPDPCRMFQYLMQIFFVIRKVTMINVSSRPIIVRSFDKKGKSGKASIPCLIIIGLRILWIVSVDFSCNRNKRLFYQIRIRLLNKVIRQVMKSLKYKTILSSLEASHVLKIVISGHKQVIYFKYCQGLPSSA